MNCGDLFYPTQVNPGSPQSVGRFFLILGQVGANVLFTGTWHVAAPCQNVHGCDTLHPFYVVGAHAGACPFRFMLVLHDNNLKVAAESSLLSGGAVRFSLPQATIEDLQKCIRSKKYISDANLRYIPRC